MRWKNEHKRFTCLCAYTFACSTLRLKLFGCRHSVDYMLALSVSIFRLTEWTINASHQNDFFAVASKRQRHSVLPLMFGEHNIGAIAATAYTVWLRVNLEMRKKVEGKKRVRWTTEPHTHSQAQANNLFGFCHTKTTWKKRNELYENRKSQTVELKIMRIAIKTKFMLVIENYPCFW